MRWDNTESPSDRPRTNGQASVSEVLKLRDHDGSVIKQFTKNSDGSLTEETVSVTAAVARVVRGTVDTALSNDGSAVRIGNVTGVEAVDFAGADDGTEIAAFFLLHKDSIPAQDVVDNSDGTFDITFHPGANSIRTESDDSKLTFSETTAGADRETSLSSAGGGGGTYAVASNSPANGSDTAFTFTGTPKFVYQNGVMMNRLLTIEGNTATFDSAPQNGDDIEASV